MLARCRKLTIEPPGHSVLRPGGTPVVAETVGGLEELATGRDGFPIRLTLLAALAWCRTAEIIDALVDLLIGLIVNGQ
jgi:hypothetical protein